MKLLKPSWINQGGALFSIDIHPDASRVVTAGQGESSGKIVIWNMSPIRSEKHEEDINVPKILCEIDCNACVNCVRWSNNGMYLASCGDDKNVTIYQWVKTDGPSFVFGSGGKRINVESWRSIHALRGHSGDVLDLAWNSDDTLLASGSVDNSVIVWNCQHFPEIVKIIKGHTGLVKGVVWDPIGNYLATQSDDKSLIIWSTVDWTLVKKIDKPFEECTATTHVLRLSWSPDGSLLVSAHAMNNSGPTAQIIERQDWKYSLDFVGHRKAVTCCRFSKMILRKGEQRPHSCCAIGSRDRALSLWLTNLKRPLAVIHEMFTHSIMDISWGKTITEVMACSLDGSVAYIELEVSEIGKPLTKIEEDNLMQEMYGKSLSQQRNITVIEDPDMLTLANDASRTRSLVTPTLSIRKVVSLNDFVPPTTQQIESRTKDGRRRITPMCIATTNEIGGIPLPFTSGFGSSDNSQATPETPAPQESLAMTVNSTVEDNFQLSKNINTGANEGTGVTEDAPAAHPKSAKTPVMSISPVVPNGPDGANEDDIMAGEVGAADVATAGRAKVAVEKLSASAKDGVETASADKAGQADRQVDELRERLTKNGVTGQELTLDIARLPPTVEKDGSCKEKSSRLLEVDCDVNHDKTAGGKDKQFKRKAMELNQCAKKPRPELRISAPIAMSTPHSAVSKSKISPIARPAMLSVPKADGKLSVVIHDGQECVSYEVNKIAAIAAYKLVCLANGAKQLWETLLGYPATCICASKSHVAVALDNRTLHVLNSSTGHYVCPLLTVDSAVSSVKLQKSVLSVVTSRCQFYCWDVALRKTLVGGVPMGHLLPKSGTVTEVSLRDAVSSLTLSDGRTYLYDVIFKCWTLTNDPEDVVVKLSDRFTPVWGKNFPLALHKSAVISRSQQLLLAAQDPVLYRTRLLSYVSALADGAMEHTLRVICQDLIGPATRLVAGTTPDSAVMDTVDKWSLAKEALAIIGVNTSLQRLYGELKEEFDLVMSLR